MPFWIVEDAGPYKSSLNILMRTSFFHSAFCCIRQAYLGKPLCNLW